MNTFTFALKGISTSRTLHYTQLLNQSSESTGIAQAQAAQRPIHIELRGELSSGWTLKRGLMLTLESDEQGSIVVSDEVFRVYGYGDTRQEALDDYIISLQEYYQILSRHDDLPTRRLFAYLKSYLHSKLS